MSEEFKAVLAPSYSTPLLNWIDDPKATTIKECVVMTELRLTLQEDRCQRARAALDGIRDLWTDLHKLSTAEPPKTNVPSRVWGSFLIHSVPTQRPVTSFATAVVEGFRNASAIAQQLARLQRFWRRHLDVLEEGEWASMISTGLKFLESSEKKSIRESWGIVSGAWAELSSQRQKLRKDLAFAVRVVPDLSLSESHDRSSTGFC